MYLTDEHYAALLERALRAEVALEEARDLIASLRAGLRRPGKPRGPYKQIPTETLIRMYVAEQQSLRQIGHAVTMDPAGVRYRLLAAGVTLRGRGRHERPADAQRRAVELAWMHEE